MVPEPLARCVVEDWVTPGEALTLAEEWRRSSTVGDLVPVVALAGRVRAHGRFHRARAEWAAECGYVGPPLPGGRPLFDDWPAFARLAGLEEDNR